MNPSGGERLAGLDERTLIQRLRAGDSDAPEERPSAVDRASTGSPSATRARMLMRMGSCRMTDDASILLCVTPSTLTSRLPRGRRAWRRALAALAPGQSGIALRPESRSWRRPRRPYIERPLRISRSPHQVPV